MHCYNFASGTHRAGPPARAGFALAFLALAVAAPFAAAQANVVENQSVYLYVDAAAGKDSNPGTKALPYKTITAAVHRSNGYSWNNIGTRIEIQPGTYREDVELGWSRHNPTLTLEAVAPGTAIVAGSDVYKNWYQGTANPAVFTHYFWGLNASPAPKYWPAALASIVYRREMVYVNGTPLTQVVSAAQMQEGTFYADPVAHLLQIWPVAGTDVYNSTVEVAVRNHTLQSHGRSNVVLRGLVFEHATSVQNDNSVNINGGRNILVDQVQANWNNWGGLHFSLTTDVTLQNSVANYNGAVGFGGFRMKAGLFQNVESDYNNWRGAQAAFYDFGMGGTKFFNVHGVTVRNFFAYNNNAEGLWFDTDNREVDVENATLVGNSVTNLQIELNDGPILINNSTLCYGETGVNLINSSQASFTGNSFYGNGGTSTQHMRPQLFLAGKQGGRNFIDWETGVYHNVISSNTTISGNTFADTATRQYNFGTYMAGSDWTAFNSTVTANNNHYYDPIQSRSFLLNGKRLGLAAWQKETGQDSQSEWMASAAPAACTAPAPAFADFAFELDASSYVAKKGTATIRLHVKNFGLTQPVDLQVMGLPSNASAAFSAPQVEQSTGTLGATRSLEVTSQNLKGTIPVTILARSAGQVHTAQVNVTFN